MITICAEIYAKPHVRPHISLFFSHHCIWHAVAQKIPSAVQPSRRFAIKRKHFTTPTAGRVQWNLNHFLWLQIVVIRRFLLRRKLLIYQHRSASGYKVTKVKWRVVWLHAMSFAKSARALVNQRFWPLPSPAAVCLVCPEKSAQRLSWHNSINERKRISSN